ncbi:MAG TPA: exodeoxyribonuclease V subunit alpha [Candidatus Binataceae bacterium]|nr:exodeoxyribonuclease V subunit alpha [Candidatus Binataceae bacterium]
MSARYENLGMQTAWRSFNRGNGARGFEARMREIEAGAPSLNLGVENVHLAAEIAALAPNLDDEQRIALILLIVVSIAALQEGSTRFPVTGLESVEPIRRLLSPLCSQSPEPDTVDAARVAIERLLLSGDASIVIGTDATEYKPLIYSPPFVYHHRVRLAEMKLARGLADLIATSPASIEITKIRDLLSQVTIRGGAGLSAEQCEAVVCACIAPLTIISGGPGTGKTSIIIAILRLLVRMGVPPGEIALAAPTGKAAYRIGESIRSNFSQFGQTTLGNLPKELSDPSTVHRLLGYSPTMRRFRHHRNNPLAAQVVIIDESSMLDLELMGQLLEALRPDARLVLLGDADQLPSVAAGAVFRDLIPAAESEFPVRGAPAAVRLTRSYRTDNRDVAGDAIFKLAGAINAGDSSAFDSRHIADNSVVTKRDAADQMDFIGGEWLAEEAGKLGAFLDRWYAQRIRGDQEFAEITQRTYHASENGFPSEEVELLRRLFDRAGSARILCITRVLDSGAERINSRLHRRAVHEAKVSPDRVAFLAGEPVMVLRNDYERMLFNGDQGLVLCVQRSDYEAASMAVFPRGENFVAFPIDSIKEDLELCYAMTVHKAQGSEFDSVALIMPEKDIPMLTREIIYTAVSRARRSVTIVGVENIIRAGISRKVERYSGVREELALSLRTSDSK